MSDYYYTLLHQSRHAELVAQAAQERLARELPHRASVLARLWARLTTSRTPSVRRPSRAAIRHA